MARRAEYHQLVLFRLFLVVVLSTASFARTQAQAPDYHACDNARGNVEPAEQEKACNAVIQLGGPKDSLAVAYSNRGQSFMRRRAYDKAIKDYGQAIELDPRLAAAYRNRGAAYFIGELYDKALPDYGAAIRLKPDEPGGYADRCSVRVMTGKPQEAKIDCDKAIDLDAKDGSGWETLAGYANEPTAAESPQEKGVFCSPADPTIDAKALEALGKAILKLDDMFANMKPGDLWPSLPIKIPFQVTSPQLAAGAAQVESLRGSQQHPYDRD